MKCKECDKPEFTLGLCGTCYQRLRRLEPAYRAAHVKRNTDSKMRRKYGITPTAYLALVEEQRGLCKICNRDVTRTLAIDHCHKTGAVRGLLCNKCNAFLGWHEKYHKQTKDYLEANNDFRDL